MLVFSSPCGSHRSSEKCLRQGFWILLVPIMAGIYIIDPFVNFRQLPGVFARVFEEALGLRQAIAGGFGAVLMNGVKRGLFSNEAGSGSAPLRQRRQKPPILPKSD